ARARPWRCRCAGANWGGRGPARTTRLHGHCAGPPVSAMTLGKAGRRPAGRAWWTGAEPLHVQFPAGSGSRIHVAAARRRTASRQLRCQVLPMEPSDRRPSDIPFRALRRRWLVLACSALLPLAAVAAEGGSGLDIAAVNDAATMTVVDAQADPAAILRAQILLDRAYFSPGEIDGRFGSNTRIAIEGFQRRHDLEVTGQVDDATWKALNGDASQPLTSYT